MKKQKYLLIVLSLVAALVLGACGATPTETTQEAVIPEIQAQTEPVVSEIVEEPLQEVVEPEAVTEPEVVVSDYANFSDADWEAYIVEKADGNHNLDFVLRQKLSASQWETVLNRMISYGADIDAEGKEALINWLVNR
jgi:uncharacterized lipoprotein YmbA